MLSAHTLTPLLKIVQEKKEHERIANLTLHVLTLFLFIRKKIKTEKCKNLKRGRRSA